MNLNMIGYVIYLLVTALIIARVGKICYRNGNVYVAQLIPDHVDLCQKVNGILLVGYYLLNLGYCAMTLMQWQQIRSTTELVETVALRTAVIVCVISILHYINIFLVTKYVNKLIQ
jgi:hypothetical protein